MLARIISPFCKFVIPAVLFVTTAVRLLSGLDYPGLRNLPGSEFIGTICRPKELWSLYWSSWESFWVYDVGSGAVRWLNGSPSVIPR